jgi:hypothetical protein
MANRFEKIKNQATADIVNSGKTNNTPTSEANNTYLKDQQNTRVKEPVNIEAKEQKNIGVNEPSGIGIEEQNDKKLKRSFMLTPAQIQKLSTLKLEHFIATNKEIDLSEIVGISIEDYYLKAKK